MPDCEQARPVVVLDDESDLDGMETDQELQEGLAAWSRSRGEEEEEVQARPVCVASAAPVWIVSKRGQSGCGCDAVGASQVDGLRGCGNLVSPAMPLGLCTLELTRRPPESPSDELQAACGDTERAQKVVRHGL